MKISVIIPTYNRSHYITKTIESFANQSISRSNYEILVVNNNSKDNTQEILEQEALKYQGFLQLKFESFKGY
jgi:glycosyltransferase involved in cell wall biosynthesis